VQEISAEAPGAMTRRTELFRPDIGIVTMVGLDHFTAYKQPLEVSTQDEIKARIAAEKGILIESLPADGVAVLNADDPQALAMRGRARARVLTFGRSETADLRATGISSAWPDRLSFTVHWRGRSSPVRTRLVGEIWIVSVLAAMAGALAAGLSLDEAIAGVERFEAVAGRNSVAEIPAGPVFISSTVKASYLSVLEEIALLTAARAPRKTLVLGQLSDYFGAGGQKYRAVARLALQAGARVIAVGKNASSIGRLAGDHAPGDVASFLTVKEAHDYLVSSHVPDELIVLKSAENLHLERIALSWKNEARCWIETCSLRNCRSCRYLEKPKSR
jgi:UDP-N-acetylmuramoyl-tripeptide--D-alanyl-D-alanine ligase